MRDRAEAVGDAEKEQSETTRNYNRSLDPTDDNAEATRRAAENRADAIEEKTNEELREKEE